ncbi:MAG TPA: HEPN domain-containing protein, partial [Gemmatimonadaceae bacterium]|nr:HEPN domain-containing protein [Gemmatimonadaceae bacterium]
IRRMIHPESTHKLDKLIAAVKRAGYDFPDFTEESKLLEPYGVEVRYPGRMPLPDEPTGRATLDAGRRIVDSARRYL